MNEILQKIGLYGIVPVIKIDNAADAKPLAKALMDHADADDDVEKVDEEDGAKIVKHIWMICIPSALNAAVSPLKQRKNPKRQRSR